MRQWLVLGVVSVILVAMVASTVQAQSKLVVTAKDLIGSNHRIEVAAGTEVVFADPHIDRVWFPPNSGIDVRRIKGGLSAAFPRPGRYEGRVTLAGTQGAGAADVMRLLVIVKEPGR